MDINNARFKKEPNFLLEETERQKKIRTHLYRIVVDKAFISCSGYMEQQYYRERITATLLGFIVIVIISLQ